MRKSRGIRFPLLVCAVTLAWSVSGHILAQSSGGPSTPLWTGYDLTWSSMDGGGGTSINGDYALSGTLGQPDAGAALSGGGYTLAGGFWGGASVGYKIYLPLILR